jgi:hypothetical protein
MSFAGQFHHPEAIRERSERILMRRISSRHKQNPVQPEFLSGLLRNLDVRNVNGIKSAPKYADSLTCMVSLHG